MKIISQIILVLLVSLLIAFCGDKNIKGSSIEMITDSDKQSSIFENIISVTNHTISEFDQKDSLAFLILPLKASCPYCRKKTIDSIVKYKNDLLRNHYLILSVNGGQKIIGSYFKEENSELPLLPGQIFLDSTNLASKFNLYDEKPTMYYTYEKKAIKKVASLPITVKEDLHQFFSGKHYSGYSLE